MNHGEVAIRFNRSFGVSHQTVLVGGAPEPLYLPGRQGARQIASDGLSSRAEQFRTALER